MCARPKEWKPARDGRLVPTLEYIKLKELSMENLGHGNSLVGRT